MSLKLVLEKVWSPDEIALSFNQVGISTLYPPQTIVSNVSGYVVKGGITAILGASASGKSVLMKGLSGRMSGFHVTGQVTLDGAPIDPSNLANQISYVPQEDFLMGELTPRETLRNVHLMKRNGAASVADAEVDDLLKKFGLDNVADNMIGTVFVRGLSGGQKKRVEVCSELIATSSVLLLDEPTSGLDGSIAYDVLSAIKKILEDKKGSLSLIISIHQPNRRILELFDHILLLKNGGEVFFGTLPEAMTYFTDIGFPLPVGYTPTDVILQTIDDHFGDNHVFDFEGNFGCSRTATDLTHFLKEIERSGMYRALRKPSSFTCIIPGSDGRVTHEHDHGDEEQARDDWKAVKVRPQQHQLVSTADDRELSLSSDDNNHQKSNSYRLYWRQYITLINRDFTLAYRDPTLYYLQFVMVCMFGILIGSAFFQPHRTIGSTMNYIPAGVLWIVMMAIYIHIFKVYHLSLRDKRLKHEISNQTYNITVAWFAELSSSAVILLCYIPGTIIAYFMMGLPGKAYPFFMFLLWITALASESMLSFITKFSEDTTVSIVACQAVLVILTVFGGGVFIPWDKCPDYWVWLQELSIFTQASRAAIMNVDDHIEYKCYLNALNQCFDPYGNQYTCDARPPANGLCYVSGRMVLHVLQGTSLRGSKWDPFGYCILIFVCFRGAILLLMYYLVDRILFNIKDFFTGVTSRAILAAKAGLQRVEGQLNAYIALRNKEDDALRGATEFHSPHALRRQLSIAHEDTAKEFVTSICSLNRVQELYPMNTKSGGHCLEWKNLSVTLKKKNQDVLIHNVSGVALPGRVLALMGPSKYFWREKVFFFNVFSTRRSWKNHFIERFE
jgi:ABC-type multidrug transport system ATPase subunit